MFGLEIAAQNEVMTVALLLTFIISVKRWFIDYFLLGLDGPLSMGDRLSARTMAHFSYVQGVATATLAIFWFGASAFSVKLGVLDALVCMIFYLTRDSIQAAAARFATQWALKRIILSETLRFAGLVLLVGVLLPATQLSSTDTLATIASDNFNRLFDAKMQGDALLRSTMFTISTFVAFSFSCHLLQHLNLVEAGKFNTRALGVLFMVCFMLYFTTTAHHVFDILVLSACVASTYYYSRVIACRLSMVLGRPWSTICDVFFFLAMTALGLANGLFYYSLLQ